MPLKFSDSSRCSCYYCSPCSSPSTPISILGEGEARLGRAREGEEERRGEGEPLEARASWELLALAISTTGRVGSSLTLGEQGLHYSHTYRHRQWALGSGEISRNQKINGVEPDLVAFCVQEMVYIFFHNIFDS